MTIRKIDLMHRQFGKVLGKVCKNCSNLCTNSYDKTYYKCSVYGISKSEATDWRLKYQACGMYNRKYKGTPVVRMVRPEKDEDVILEGQVGLW